MNTIAAPCPRCGLPIAYGETQVGDTECGVAHTPERCVVLLRMESARRGAEIERLRAALVPYVREAESHADQGRPGSPYAERLRRARGALGYSDEPD